MTTLLFKAMTISGADSSGAGGIQADLQTFAAFGVYGTSVLTVVTAQNTREVAAVAEVPEEVVIAQIDTVLEDIGADAIKTGMLAARSIVECVVDRLEAWGAPRLVVDPVMPSADGLPLLKADAIATVQRELLPMALIATLSLPETEVLGGRAIAAQQDAHEAARAIHALGPGIVVIKGTGNDILPADLVFDGEEFTELSGEPIDSLSYGGVGSVYSAAITALLARNVEPMVVVEQAKRFIAQAAHAAVAVGAGPAPLNPRFALQAITPS